MRWLSSLVLAALAAAAAAESAAEARPDLTFSLDAASPAPPQAAPGTPSPAAPAPAAPAPAERVRLIVFPANDPAAELSGEVSDAAPQDWRFALDAPMRLHADVTSDSGDALLSIADAAGTWLVHDVPNAALDLAPGGYHLRVHHPTAPSRRAERSTFLLYVDLGPIDPQAEGVAVVEEPFEAEHEAAEPDTEAPGAEVAAAGAVHPGPDIAGTEGASPTEPTVVPTGDPAGPDASPDVPAPAVLEDAPPDPAPPEHWAGATLTRELAGAPLPVLAVPPPGPDAPGAADARLADATLAEGGAASRSDAVAPAVAGAGGEAGAERAAEAESSPQPAATEGAPGAAQPDAAAPGEAAAENLGAVEPPLPVSAGSPVAEAPDTEAPDAEAADIADADTADADTADADTGLAAPKSADPGPDASDAILLRPGEVFPAPRRVGAVGGEVLNMRTRPSRTAPVARQLRRGDEVVALECRAAEGLDWCRVYPQGLRALKAWVAAEYLVPLD